MPVGLDPSSWAYAFPMVRAGGVFIFIMGAGVVLGALLPNRRRSLLIFGAAVATIAMVFLAARLSAPFGTPSRLQLWFLFGSIGAEAILVRVAVALYRQAGERSLLLAILFAVGLHFLPMAVAFGPICAALGVTLCVCAGIGLWLRPGISLNRLWASDGFIKMAFGAIMLLAP
jgi:Family of unknown function (DUF6609)